MVKVYLAIVYIALINLITNLIIANYIEKILSGKGKIPYSLIGIKIIYPLLGSTVGPILFIFLKLV